MTHLRFAAAAASFAILGLASTRADAHFVLVAPESWATQDSFGDPQLSEPCGQADPGAPAVPSGIVTMVQQGSILTITIDETIFHPGHYRVSLAADQASLPADPPVTPGSTPCGSTEIATNPTLPLLADGLLVHDVPYSGQQTVQVQLPPGMTCTSCTLQVTEFMSEHPLNNPGGCFYHHCADLSITGGAPDSGAPDSGPADSGPPDSGALDSGSPDSGALDSGIPDSGALDSGISGGHDAGGAEKASTSGCGSASQQGITPIAALGVLLVAALRQRRRRHSWAHDQG